MTTPQGPYGTGPAQPPPSPPRVQNPPPRVAPTPGSPHGAGRTVLAVVLALVILAAMGTVMFVTQATWGQLWWQWPRGWFNVPRLVVYGTVVAGIALYALLGRLVARGTVYVMGLVLVAAGGVALAWLWFLVSLFTGLGL